MLERSWFKYGLNFTDNMKKIFPNFVTALFAYAVLFSTIFFASCGSPTCGIPSNRLGSINVDATVFIGGPTGSCPFPGGQQFINAVNTGASAFASVKTGNPTSYIPEIIVTGTCPSGAAWSEVIKQGQITLTALPNNQVRFRFNPAVTSNNEYTVIIRVATPCVSGTCAGITNYREILSPDAVKITSPTAGSTFLASKLLAGVAEESCQ
jgi:hypothetical protein